MAGFSGKNEAAVLQAARAFAAFVQAETQRRGGVPLRLLGPAPMSVAMVKQQYRYKLTLKCRGAGAVRRGRLGREGGGHHRFSRGCGFVSRAR